MRRFLPWALGAVVVVAAGALAIHHYVKGPLPSIVGTWRGNLMPSPGSHASPEPFMAVVDPNQQNGTWRAGPGCAGTLRLKDISNGYRHYYRLGASDGCAPPGVDCFQRKGARMVDVFISSSGKENSAGEFRRVS